MNCHTTTDLHPWLLNGSLQGAERASVLGHLAECSACRVELGETAEVWELLDVHVTSSDLVAYALGNTALGNTALGSTATTWSRDQLERHLAICPACRLEVELVKGSVEEDTAKEDTTDRPATPAKVLLMPPARTTTRTATRTATRISGWRTPVRLAAAMAGFALAAYGFLTLSPQLREPTRVASLETPAETPATRIDRTGSVLLADDFESGLAPSWRIVSEAPAVDITEDAVAQFANGFEPGQISGWQFVTKSSQDSPETQPALKLPKNDSIERSQRCVRTFS